MSKDMTPANPGELLIYPADDGSAGIRVLLAGESVWLTQRLMADLYQIGVNTINHHIKGVSRDGELISEATIRRHRVVQNEGEKDEAATCKDYLQVRQNGNRAVFRNTGLAELVK